MSQVAFFVTYRPTKPDPPPPKASPYEKRLRQKRSPGRWQKVTSLSCRDFTKNTYDYRDTAPHLADRGRFYKPCTAEANVIPARKDKFSTTQLRHLNFTPGKLQSEHRKVFPEQTVSSWTQLSENFQEVPRPKRVTFRSMK